MGKRAARGTSKEPDSTSAEAGSPHAPWLNQLDAPDSDSGEGSPYDSEAELSGSEAEDSSDGDDDAPLGRGAGSFHDDGRNGVSSDDDFDTAVVDVLQHADPLVESPQTDAAVGEDAPDDDATQPSAPGSDSSEDERENRNTVGEVPLEWYKDELHVGYDREGRKVLRGPRRDRMDRLLAQADGGAGWRTVYDEYNGEEIVLSKDEFRMIQRIREGRFPHVEVDPFPDEDDWYTREREIHPLQGGPEPKRRFTPSKWEEKKIVKLVRAMRKGWLKKQDDKPPEKPPVYLLWQDDGLAADHTQAGLSYIPAPKPKLPSHEESYNPPAEYLPTEEERAAAAMAAEADESTEPQPFQPRAYDSLRLVPAYAEFIKERFERCLDLYLCPRTRRRRVQVDDPQQLLPKLPKPKDLQPFPTQLTLQFLGHSGKVRCSAVRQNRTVPRKKPLVQVTSIAPDHTGQWLASGSADGTMRLWEVGSGRCVRTWQLGAPVACVAWCPNPALRILSAVMDKAAILVWSGVGDEENAEAALAALKLSSAASSSKDGAVVQWRQRDDGGLELQHSHSLRQLTWHSRGDYFATVAPTGNTQAVMIHQLSKQATQNPFRKNRGRVSRVLFHPSKPFLLVATEHHVRVYNLVKQALARKLVGSSGGFTCLAIHSSGDHVLAGSEDRRLAWYDLDLSSKPYKALRYHKAAVRGAAYHRGYPLFASSSDDGAVHVFHGMVYQDLMTNPLIVPVKILRGHTVVSSEGVLDVAFHPTQPWLFTAGADTTINLFTNS